MFANRRMPKRHRSPVTSARTATPTCAVMEQLEPRVLLSDQAALSFSLQPYIVNNDPVSVVATDVDGDGRADLVSANRDSDSVSVLRNNGDGTFASKVDYVVAHDPESVFAADVDGDGWNDLVTANASGSNLDDNTTVSVLMNNGDGTFAAKVDYTVGTAQWHIFAADVDGDGWTDLVTAGVYDATISVLMNNGDGTFAPTVDYTVGFAPHSSIFAADLDGDGWIDLVTANADDTVSVLRNIGDGTFASDVPYFVGTDPASVFAADLDGDGRVDLVTAGTFYSDDHIISVLRNNGDGTFATKVDYTVGYRPTSVYAADLDGDGRPDLVTANIGTNAYTNGSVSVLRNNGDGSFALRVDYTVGSYPTSVYAADLDGDGRLDLATANEVDGSISVLLQSAVNLPAPTLVNPAGGGSGVSTSPNFHWSSVSGNHGYRLIVATTPSALPSDPNDTGDGSNAAINQVLGRDVTSYTSDTPLASDTTYYWEVHALGDSQSGQVGDWSSHGSFTTTAAVANNTVAELNALVVSPGFAVTGTSSGGVNQSERIAENQLDIARPYIDDFITVGLELNVPPALLAGIASRESAFGSLLDANGYGDDGQAYGMLQLDVGSVPNPDKSDGPRGLAHIREAANFFVDNKLAAVLRSHPAENTRALQLFVATSYYNGGDGLDYPRSDEGTTGGDYANDVWIRARVFAEKLQWSDNPGIPLSASKPPVIATSGLGTAPTVRAFDPLTQQLLQQFHPFSTDFTGGLTVASGDVNADGTPDIIVAAGPGGSSNIRVFDGNTDQPIAGPLGSFLAYPGNGGDPADPHSTFYTNAFQGKINLAAGDINGDGHDDIIITVAENGPPHLKVFSGADGSVLMSTLVYPGASDPSDPAYFANAFQGGVRVASGDVTGDGRDDIITGAGPGAGPHVKVFSGTTQQVVKSYFAYDPAYAGGVRVAAGDYNGDGTADIITAPGIGAGPNIKVINASDGATLASFWAYDPGFLGGVWLASGDINADGKADILVTPGAGAASNVKVFGGGSKYAPDAISSFFAFDPSYTGGSRIAVPVA